MRHDGKCVKKLIYLMSPIKKNVIYFFRIYCKGITWRDFKWISSATFTNVFKTEEVKQAFERVLKSKKKTTDRSSHQKVSCEKCAFKYFAKFARKHLCWSLFLIKFGSLQPATLSKKKKKKVLVKKFSSEFCTIFKNPFFTEHIQFHISFWMNS